MSFPLRASVQRHPGPAGRCGRCSVPCSFPVLPHGLPRCLWPQQTPPPADGARRPPSWTGAGHSASRGRPLLLTAGLCPVSTGQAQAAFPFPRRRPVARAPSCGVSLTTRAARRFGRASSDSGRRGCPRPQPRASENCGCLRMKLASCRPPPPGAVPRTHPSGSGHQGRLRNGPQREVDGSGRRGREFGLCYLEFGLRQK